MTFCATVQPPQPPNGFLNNGQDEACEPMLVHQVTKPKIADSGGGGSLPKKTASNNSTNLSPNAEVTGSRPRKKDAPGSTSTKNFKVIQALVLLIILALVAILCSVFIKPEIFFSDYGKPCILFDNGHVSGVYTSMNPNYFTCMY